jgi:hypothetical protein
MQGEPPQDFRPLEPMSCEGSSTKSVCTLVPEIIG